MVSPRLLTLHKSMCTAPRWQFRLNCKPYIQNVQITIHNSFQLATLNCKRQLNRLSYNTQKPLRKMEAVNSTFQCLLVISWRCWVAFKQKMIRPARLFHFDDLHARKSWVCRSQTTTHLLICVKNKPTTTPQLVRTMCILLETKTKAFKQKSSSKSTTFPCNTTDMIRSSRPHRKPIYG